MNNRIRIAYDREESTSWKPRYFVYDEENRVIYKGTYTQCLVVRGALLDNPDVSLNEVNGRCNGFLFDRVTE